MLPKRHDSGGDHRVTPPIPQDPSDSSSPECEETVIVTPADLGAAIRVARRRERLTQQQLADLAGLSDRTLRDIERRTGGPSITTVLRVCEVLGVTLWVER